MATAASLQKTLETIYRIDGSLCVQDFRIDGACLEILLGEGKERREMLLVHHDGEHTDIALYLDDEILLKAGRFLRDPKAHLDEFCAVAEGVSHFVYFTFCGSQQERPVSQIELELQAEIDKFLMLKLICPTPQPDLVKRLFEDFKLAEQLTVHEQERYLVANREGRRYARWIDREFAQGRGPQALHDARQLYRKPLRAKLERINGLAA